MWLVLSAVAIAVALTGCVKPQEIYLANGDKANVTRCGPELQAARKGALSRPSGIPGVPGPGQGFADAMPPPHTDWGVCLAQASKLCGQRGCDVLEGSNYERGMMIMRCRGQ